MVGAVVSLADKFDSVVAGFSAGLAPTSSSDPFGLRRAGNGIIKVAAEVLKDFDLMELTNKLQVHYLEFQPNADLLDRLERLLRERLEFYLKENAQLRYDTIRAIAQSSYGWAVPSRAYQRALALELIRDTEDFSALSSAAKRTRNLLIKSPALDDFDDPTQINENLLTDGPERELFDAFVGMRQRLNELEQRGEYLKAFQALAEMRPFVDRFFDKVLVMDERADVRANRLALLSRLNVLVFRKFADLSQIESKALDSVGASTSKTSDE